MTSDDGLRARKQRETREAIHRAAVRHALIGGPDSVTVAAISAEANVSTRTFFNYFPSKEDAMLGFHEGLPTDDELADFGRDDSEDLLRDTVALMRNVFSSAPANSELMAERRRLIGEHPQLMQRQMSRVYTVEQRIATVVADRMRASARYAKLPDIEAAARMLVMLATSVIRFTIRESAKTPTTPLSEADTHRMLEESLDTLREVINKIP